MISADISTLQSLYESKIVVEDHDGYDEYAMKQHEDRLNGLGSETEKPTNTQYIDHTDALDVQVEKFLFSAPNSIENAQELEASLNANGVWMKRLDVFFYDRSKNELESRPAVGFILFTSKDISEPAWWEYVATLIKADPYINKFISFNKEYANISQNPEIIDLVPVGIRRKENIVVRIHVYGSTE